MATKHGRLPVEGTFNFRDVGGYPAGKGRTRAGQLFRSDALSRVTAAGLDYLTALKIGYVVDLRTGLELSQDDCASRAIPWATHVSVPILGGSRHSLVSGPTISLEELYRQVLLESGWSLAVGVSAIAETGRTPVLVNCTAGKDRTGLLIALTLEAAGVDRQAVIADYTQSALNLDGDWVDETLSTLVSHGVAISPKLFEVIGGSPDHAMGNILSWLDREYGSPEGYLREHGLLPHSVEALRDKLVIGG